MMETKQMKVQERHPVLHTHMDRAAGINQVLNNYELEAVSRRF